jgi:hypothetical protein
MNLQQLVSAQQQHPSLSAVDLHGLTKETSAEAQLVSLTMLKFETNSAFNPSPRSPAILRALE